jgi:uncharacterized protein with ParB-like and HNH nuclease domain
VSKNLEKSIIKINELLKMSNLNIPEYQRPYKWNIKNVNQLIDDIFNFKDKKSYRFGTIVLHKEIKEKTKEVLNIVDGQQRIITLYLIFLAIKNFKYEDSDIQMLIKEKIFLESQLNFENSISKYNIEQNYQEITRRIGRFDIHVIDFLLEKCEVVLVKLEDISEAFQFFDSQNARGKDLAPHDLLKAYHLREMFDSSEVEKTQVVQTWENMDQLQLADLFSNRLFRIRNWSRGNSAKFFTKHNVDLFKGMSINSKTTTLAPYAKLYQMANVFVDNYNKSSDRLVDFQNIHYPFQLDLPILNGKRFFEMVSYYKTRYENFKENNEIIKILDNYTEKNRMGDRYIRMLFDCALIFYVDKFDENEIEEVIRKLFIWAYKKRLEMQAVYLETIDNYAIKTKVFKTIRDATSYKEVVNMHIDSINESDIKLKNLDNRIKKQFKNLGYYND